MTHDLLSVIEICLFAKTSFTAVSTTMALVLVLKGIVEGAGEESPRE